MKQELYIAWNDNNFLGIPIIDEQHRSIVAIINTLHYFVEKHMELEVLTPIISTIYQYTIIHFKTEEMMLKEADYPSIDDHILLHKHLVNEMKSVADESTQERDVEPLLKFLKAWWLNHINREDRKYVSFITSQK